MRWNRFVIETTTNAEEILISELCDLGIEGVEVEDSTPLSEEELSQMFVDIMPQNGSDDGSARLSFYLEEGKDPEPVLKEVRAMLLRVGQSVDIGPGTISRSVTEDLDWINNWKQYFHQFTVDDFLIIPSWEEVSPSDQDKKILHIDPGTAFGTGMHETTQLVLRQLGKTIRGGEKLLDVGTGSGILGIAALMLGAGKVFATDLDPCALSAVEDNLSANRIDPASFEMRIGNLIDDEALQKSIGRDFQVVCANILADVLIHLTPVVEKLMAPGGIYITSGILDTKEEEVLQAVKGASLEVLEVTRQGEWVCISARKKA